MASPQQPGPSLAQPTRIQLDELELLMERMLALPVNPPEDLPTQLTVPEPGPGMVQELVQIRQWASPQGSMETGLPTSHIGLARPLPIRESVGTPILLRETSRAPTASRGTFPVPAALRPVVWINNAFDRSMGWLGPIGRFWIGPRGRGLLAWTGLLLSVAALAWIIAEGLGLDLIELSR